MSMKNMVAMFGAMALLRRVDQEEPIVLLYARFGYIAYVVTTVLIYTILHFRIKGAKDTTVISVPVTKKGPSLSDALAQAREAAEKAEAEATRKAEGEEPGDSDATSVQTTDKSDATTAENNQDNKKDEDAEEAVESVTVMEYDFRQLATSRQSWVTSACFLALIHYFTQSVSPLVMSSITGLFRLLTDDPLVQIHIRGTPSVGKLSRPFTAEKSPFASLLKDAVPSDPPTATTATSQPTQPEGEDLHDDGEDDEDDDGPENLTDLKDENIKSDFDDEDVPADTKKNQ